MSDTRQFNVRVPDDARDVLSRIAARLREDHTFAARIEAWLDSLDDDTADETLAERVARIEARLDGMNSDTPQGTPWTTGEGRGRRLTAAGEAEVERRIEAGDDDATVAEALGVSTNTIRARRKAMGERLL